MASSTSPSWSLQSVLSQPSTSSTPPSGIHPEISSDHQTKLDQLIAHFGDEQYQLPVKPQGPADGPKTKQDGLTDREKMFLSEEGILRFLVATKGDVPATIKRLEHCLEWRREAGVDDVDRMAKEVESEFSQTGGQFVLGYSKSQMPVIIMVPSRRDTPPNEAGLMHLFFLLERAIDLMPPGVGKVTFLIDFGGHRKHSTPLHLARKWVDVLQNCYPERLGLGMIINIPWIINMFLNAVYVFMDPVTKHKISLNPSIEEIRSKIIPSDQLMVEYGGQMDGLSKESWADESVGLHERYWSELLTQCKSRREVLAKWREMGGKVGLSETSWKEAWASMQTSTAVDAMDASQSPPVPEIS